MKRARTAYAVGIVNHRSYADLLHCIDSVKSQSAAPAALVVVDLDPDPQRLREFQRCDSDAVWEPGPNRGFGAGANTALARMRQVASELEFGLILNPDVRLEPEFAENLIHEMLRHPRVALASGKLLRDDGRTIDSAGIRMPRHRRPRDRGSQELDRGQYDRVEFVFGASGAALMTRLSALDELAVEGEVFDEDFFLYHEDTDLAWRAHRLGWRVLYVPSARAIHRRGWQRDRRFQIPVSIRRHSFKNHYLQMIKNERGRDFLANLPAIAVWEVLRLGFALLRDRALLAGYRDAWRLSRRAWRKRRLIQLRAPS